MASHSHSLIRENRCVLVSLAGRPVATPLFLLTNSPRAHVDDLFHRFHPSGNGPITSTRSEARAILAKACARSARACPCAWVCVCMCVCVCVCLAVCNYACVRACVRLCKFVRARASNAGPSWLGSNASEVGRVDWANLFFFFTPLPFPPSLLSVPHTFTHAHTHLFSTSTHIHTTLLVFL